MTMPPVTPRINVFAIDDHSLVLDGICSILRKIDFINEIVALTDCSQACQLLKERSFDVYIIDLELQDMDGFDLIKIIQEEHEEAPIIINTMHEELWTVNHLVELGVKSIVLKSSSSEHFEKAILHVISGKEYFCPRFEYLKQAYAIHRNKLGRKSSLPTKRELEVLNLIAHGATTEEIGEKLFISVNTVESFRKNLMIKLEARNMAHLVTIAIQQRLIESFDHQDSNGMTI